MRMRITEFSSFFTVFDFIFLKKVIIFLNWFKKILTLTFLVFQLSLFFFFFLQDVFDEKRKFEYQEFENQCSDLIQENENIFQQNNLLNEYDLCCNQVGQVVMQCGVIGCLWVTMVPGNVAPWSVSYFFLGLFYFQFILFYFYLFSFFF